MPVNKFLPHCTSGLHHSSNIIRKVKQDKMGGASGYQKCIKIFVHTKLQE